ncbi:MAG: hypothetical protein HY234_07880 [Acidobacteria bacterium]|nr:hypothetical protein [Acidobacteriota bacterium]MBI3662949.1 hypothetical protein [Acidobacteriota bacterium]
MAAKLTYLEAIQQGYEVALDKFDGFAREFEPGWGTAQLPPAWTRFVVLPKADKWERVSEVVDWFCQKEENANVRVVEAVRAIVENTWKSSADSQSVVTTDERVDRIVRRSCRTLEQSTSNAFVQGFGDGNAYFWMLVREQLSKTPLAGPDPADEERYKQVLAARVALHRDMFSPLSAGRPLTDDLNVFCGQPFNQEVPVSLVIAAVVMRAKGMDAAQMGLEAFYCKHLPTYWHQGREIKARACAGFTFVGSTPPILDKPFGLIVSVRNDSEKPFEVDWNQWSLSWADKKGQLHSKGALDPEKVAKSIRRRSMIAAALAGFGAGLNAGMPRTATVYGPQGIQTVTVNPPPGAASAATRQAAEPYVQAGTTMSDTIIEVSLMRTTLMPRQYVVAVVFFEKPKAPTYTLSFTMADHPKVSIKLGDQH